ncbi:MAG: hypothetical protein ACRDS0_35300, partial [Pseudonocardiaceae bacterium]
MPSKDELGPLRFGGWYSYREWAEHGFIPRAAHVGSDEREAKRSADAGKKSPAIASKPKRIPGKDAKNRRARPVSGPAAPHPPLPGQGSLPPPPVPRAAGPG